LRNRDPPPPNQALPQLNRTLRRHISLLRRQFGWWQPHCSCCMAFGGHDQGKRRASHSARRMAIPSRSSRPSMATASGGCISMVWCGDFGNLSAVKHLWNDAELGWLWLFRRYVKYMLSLC
jgi:hypothetical protein